jgi:transposase InsO family protein
MNIHENARTTPSSRALLVRRIREEGWTALQAAAAAGISRRTAYKWLRRFGQEGSAGLRDRSSCAHQKPHALPEEWCQLVAYLRSYRQPARLIARELGMARSTVSATLARQGLGPQRALQPPRPPCRYERRQPGELLHLDTKKLGRFSRPGHRVTGRRDGKDRGIGWDLVHVAIDDHSRIAYAEILADESPRSCAAFLAKALRWFADQGIRVRRVLTDNGNGYRSHRFREACQSLQLRHLRTRPRTPQTNGKAERFIQSLLREWAYARLYPSSVVRAQQLPRWLRFYNEDRPHASLAYQPPISRRPPLCEQRS